MGAFLLQDWLALHGIGAGQMRQMLRVGGLKAQGSVAPGGLVPDLARPVDVGQVAGRLARALPDLEALLERVLREVRFDLAPDRQRFPRAFTLDDDGTGRVLVSCPVTGKLSDLLMLAHEMAHACQSLACLRAPPPIQREMAAYVAESLLVRACALEGDPAAADLTRLLAARQDRMDRDAAQLLQVLDAPSTPYAYRWNYPPAWVLAQRAIRLAPADRLCRLVSAPDDLLDLAREFGLLSNLP